MILDRPAEHSLRVPAAELHAAMATQLGNGARFVDLFAVDRELHVLLSVDRKGEWVRLVTDIAGTELAFPTVAEVAPAAGWYERELFSQLAIHADGAELVPAPDGVVDYPLGPIRSGVVESGHYLLRTVGEEIVDFALRLFYKHRGIEQRGTELGIEHLPLLAERISGTDAFAESLALCLAIEDLADVQAPPRASALRTIFAELERLYNHIGYQADLCQATGLVVAQAQFDIQRERLLRLNARLTGHRYLFGMNVAGGLSRDLDASALRAIGQEVEEINAVLTRIGQLTFGSSSHVDRLEATGMLKPEDAAAYAVVGPVGRASGQDRDARRDHPYAAYADAELLVPVYETGDAFARARVRLEEAHQSVRLIGSLIDRVPDGSVRECIDTLAAGVSGMGWAESARGETVHWLCTDEAGQVRRYRVRTGSFANWQAFSLAIPGHNILTDFPVIEQSFGLSYAGNDR